MHRFVRLLGHFRNRSSFFKENSIFQLLCFFSCQFRLYYLKFETLLDNLLFTLCCRMSFECASTFPQKYFPHCNCSNWTVFLYSRMLMVCCNALHIVLKGSQIYVQLGSDLCTLKLLNAVLFQLIFLVLEMDLFLMILWVLVTNFIIFFLAFILSTFISSLLETNPPISGCPKGNRWC